MPNMVYSIGEMLATSKKIFPIPLWYPAFFLLSHLPLRYEAFIYEAFEYLRYLLSGCVKPITTCPFSDNTASCSFPSLHTTAGALLGIFLGFEHGSPENVTKHD